MKKSIKLNAILNTINTVMSMLFPLITFPYISRVLGVEEIGKYNFANSVISYFVLIAGLGIGTYAVREGAKIRDDKEKFHFFAKEVFSINIYSSIFSFVLLFICFGIFEKINEYAPIIWILSIQMLFAAFGRSWLYVIYEEYLFITLRSIALHCISFVLLLLFVKDADDVLAYSLVSISSIIGSNIINLLCSRKYCKLNFTYKPSKKHIMPILLIFSTSVSIIIYGSSDITMLGVFGTDYNVGVYSVSVKIYNIVKQLLAAILTVSIPRFSYYIGKNKLDEYNNLFAKIVNVLILLLLPATIGLSMVSEDVVILLAGEEYLHAAKPLSTLCLAMIFNLFAYMFGYCVLIPNKKEKQFFWATLISAVVNVILNLMLIPHLFEVAAAITTVISEAVAMCICIYGARKFVKIHINIKNLICTLIGCSLIIIICMSVSRMEFSRFVSLFLSVSLSILGFGIIQILLKNQIFVGNLMKIFKRA